MSPEMSGLAPGVARKDRIATSIKAAAQGSGCSRGGRPVHVVQQDELQLLERWVPTVFAGRRVLEVGAGTGEWTRFIAPQTASLVATDACSQALARAQAQVPSRKVRFVQADAHALPADLGRFDAAFAGFLISRTDPARLADFLASLHARLEPGAKVLLLDRRSPPVGRQERTVRRRPLAEDRLHRLLRHLPSGEDLLQKVSGFGTRPVLHQWMFFWALCYEVAAPGAGAG